MSGLKVSWEAIIVDPRYNEVPRDWQNLFAITRFRCIEVLFHTFTTNGVVKIFRYTENFVIQRFVISRFLCM